MRVLLVEDDPVIGEATGLHLERHEHEVTWVTDGLEAWRAFTAASPAYDVVLSDVVLPGMDGVTLTRRIRELGTTPVVLVSARTDAVDVVGGLEAGADDYVTKPFDVQVLLARLRSAVRRATPAPPAAPATPPPDDEASVTRWGDLSLDRASLTVRVGETPVALTPTELRLLLALAEESGQPGQPGRPGRPGRVVSRRALLDRVWEEPWREDTHLVDVHVQRLRSKIGADRVETVRGFGYRLVTG